MTDKALEAAAREIAANHWSVDSNMGEQAYQDAHWLFHADDAKAAISAYLSALPGEAEVVAWKVSAKDRLDQFFEIEGEADQWANSPNVADSIVTPLVTLAALQAMQVRAEKAERERDEAYNKGYSARDEVVSACRSRAEAAEARVKELEAENARLRRLDAEYGRVETAIIMADPDFDGDSPHDNCGDRLIASVHRLRDLAALKGGSNG